MEAVSGRLYFPSAIWSSQESIALSELYMQRLMVESLNMNNTEGGRNNIKDQRIFILDF